MLDIVFRCVSSSVELKSTLYFAMVYVISPNILPDCGCCFNPED